MDRANMCIWRKLLRSCVNPAGSWIRSAQSNCTEATEMESSATHASRCTMEASALYAPIPVCMNWVQAQLCSKCIRSIDTLYLAHSLLPSLPPCPPTSPSKTKWPQFHAIGFEGIIQASTSKYVHHLTLTAYTGTHHCGQDCIDWVLANLPDDDDPSPQSAYSDPYTFNNMTIPDFCYQQFANIFAWAPGSADVQLPDNVGFRFGNVSYTSLRCFVFCIGCSFSACCSWVLFGSPFLSCERFRFVCGVAPSFDLCM